ncbi:hypothetical protein QFZ41_002473 [Luteibacter sp. W1I16]|uniref:DUF302 domain-containing protein n=1 Tax=Luteibacter sp. W1I16 TaxID=3373922 RepID=UPI003D1CFADF
MTNHNISRRTVAVEHIRITSSLPFAIVKENIERILPALPDSLLQMMGSGDKERVREIEEKGPKLYIFTKRDHGRTLTVATGPRNAIQYVVGNPTTAVKMTRHDIRASLYDIRASLYAPLRITLFESDEGETVLEYDLPSSLFGQFGNPEVTEVGLYLDRELESTLLLAAG